jgi:NADPH2:quinone reductase
MLHNHKRKEHSQISLELSKIVEDGGLMPVLDANRYSLEEVGKAHTCLSSGAGMGKVVVDI